MFSTCLSFQTDSKPQQNHLAVEQSDLPGDGEMSKRSSFLDSEVSEVLFEFDTMLTELERENLIENSPSPMPQSPVSKTAPIDSESTPLANQDEQKSESPNEVPSVEIESSPGIESSSCSLNDSESSIEKSPSDLEPGQKKLRNLPKVNEIKQRFMLPQKYSPIPPTSPTKEDIPKSRGNVKSMIAQMQASSETELPLVHMPPEDVPTGARRNSKSIQNKIEELTRLRAPGADEGPEQTRSYTPPIVRRKVQSVFFEQARSKSLEPKLTKSQENLADKDTPKETVNVEAFEEKVNSSVEVPKEEPSSSLEESKEAITSSLEELKQDSSTELTKVETNHEPPSPKVNKEEKTHHIEDATQSKKNSVSSESVNGDSHLVAFDILPAQPSRKRSEIAKPDDIELSFKEDKGSPKSERKLSKQSSQDHVELVIGVRENGLYSPPQIIDTEDHPLKKSSEYDHLMKKNEYDHLEPLSPTNGMHYHRHRSASDLTGVHRAPKMSREEKLSMVSEVNIGYSDLITCDVYT